MLRFRSLASLLAGAATFAIAWGASAEAIKVGVTAGPHAQILEAVKPIAAKDGLDIQILEFTDYVIPNQALADGDLDANSFQHQPYLDNQVKDRGFDLVSVGKTVVYPIGIYSKKVKSLEELPAGAKFAIPNDPTNGGRVLLMLQAKGLIKLKDGGTLKASPIDIVENPKKLEIVELDAAQLPRSLDDVTAAAINTNFALEAGIDPVKDAIAREAAESPYANIIAVRKADKDKPWVATLVKAYHDPAVKDFILTKFKNAVIPAF
ncbi:MetQ/NlpA family ABC transporter substrate-binding protein [Azospirillum picis]|uniref:D-methionine transport system substrate-binding protein n=1 Tax=Azospirillum picis TaxID=488438 RepID=A0ABU0MDS9_9PROT|nr:MetQ/NlpA family ABC transporter substrate-binding protein [Azospirillum picis]MBP2297395.1 D-methionine transport system substrate-binding protein [Azospirillum picis]MDQ0531582.1 D-methionine transport system substrate-binding protein [Azospirillum picis]